MAKALVMRGILLVCLVCMFGLVNAQVDRYWFCGREGMGIDWGGCEPSLVQGDVIAFEGVATVSSDQGELLFYTNSDFVWNRNHELMQGGEISEAIYDPIFGQQEIQNTATQVGIARRPGTDEYYVFTTDIQVNGFFPLRYFTVDMSANGGLGAVTGSTLMNNSPHTEKVCVVPRQGQPGFWVITHAYFTNQFLVWLVDENGVSDTFTPYLFGQLHQTTPNNLNARGELIANPQGTQLALVQDRVGGAVELFDFEPSTGAITSVTNVGTLDHGFGLSFSPDGSKLYASTWSSTNSIQNRLVQFDLDLPVAGGFQQTLLATSTVPNPFGSLKIAPDGKIYVARALQPFLGRIDDPNASGAACGYVADGFFLGGDESSWGLNNIWEVPSGLSASLTSLVIDAPDQVCGPTEIGVEPTPGFTYTWNDGSTGPSLLVENSGTYTLTAVSAGCELSGQATVEVIDLVAPDLGDEVVVCGGDAAEFSVEPNGAAVEWSTGETASTIAVTETQTVSVTLTDGPCSVNASVDVVVPESELPTEEATRFTVCEGEQIAVALPPGWDAWSINGEAIDDTFAVVNAGAYTVELVNACGVSEYTLTIDEEDCSCPVYVPNAFTPDGDDRNEVFAPVFECAREYRLCVFNRWGECVYDSARESLPYRTGSVRDGDYYTPVGVYVWQLELEGFPGRYDAEVLRGTVTVLR